MLVRRKSENILMKNIIASNIPIFKTKESGEDERLFSNLMSARSRKKIEIPITKSNSNLK
jgi:hypothetical protein